MQLLFKLAVLNKHSQAELYGATCEVMKGRINESQAGLVVAMVLREEGISTSYATDPMAQQFARLMYVQNGGCR